MPELFGTNLHYSGIPLGFQLGAAIRGGLTIVIATAIVAWSNGATWPVSFMLVALGLVTFYAVLFTRETATRPMRLMKKTMRARVSLVVFGRSNSHYRSATQPSANKRVALLPETRGLHARPPRHSWRPGQRQS